MAGKSITDRFWAKVAKTDTCWLWTGHVDTYGRFKFEGRSQPAHRVAWQLLRGPIPDWTGQTTGVCVIHACDNPICVNPAHLRLGNQAENVADMKAKGRADRTKKARGAANGVHTRPERRARGVVNGAAKLAEAEVLAIRKDTRTQDAIAADYRIGQSHVSRIKRGIGWAHL